MDNNKTWYYDLPGCDLKWWLKWLSGGWADHLRPVWAEPCKLEEILVEDGLYDELGQLYNMDESGMPLDPKPPKTLCARGAWNPLSKCSDIKAQIEAIACVSGANQVLLPMVVWDRKALA